MVSTLGDELGGGGQSARLHRRLLKSEARNIRDGGIWRPAGHLEVVLTRERNRSRPHTDSWIRGGFSDSSIYPESAGSMEVAINPQIRAGQTRGRA